MAKSRKEIPLEDRWNVDALYSNADSWEREFATLLGKEGPLSPETRWPVLAAYKGRLHDGPEAVKATLDAIFSMDRQLSKLYSYAHLRHDEETTDDFFKTAFSKIASLSCDFAEATSWFEPELLSLPEPQLRDFLASPVLKEYAFHLRKIVRMKNHTLSQDNERILALAGKALQAPQKAFSAINDADFKFGPVLDSQGVPQELTHSRYHLLLRSKDRVLRKNAFSGLHQHYASYQNTLTELLQAEVETHVFVTRCRRYSSCLEAALYPRNIDTSVYESLIAAVRKNLSVMHHYMHVRKKALGVSELHLYDLYVPLVPALDLQMSYKEAEEIVIASTEPLGSSYQEYLREGLQKQRWVDRYENLNKRSGAYSGGCYDSLPYILMNYQGALRDVFTLAHEAGHSMHSFLSRRQQPYPYADYPIFVAEVASTFNEALLISTLLSRATSKEEKAYLINQQVEDIRTTLFRQTMFAEFELQIHRWIEKGEPLTPKKLCEEYRTLNEIYFGPDVVIDPEIAIEWARIPHFYYNFYVYQYATGISAALALVEAVKAGGVAERERYLSFLRGGGSRFPLDLLSDAGIDMRSPAPVEQAIAKFETLVSQLDTLLSS